AVRNDHCAIRAIVESHLLGSGLRLAVADAVVDPIAGIGAALFEPDGDLAVVVACRAARLDGILLGFLAGGTPSDPVTGFVCGSALLIIHGNRPEGECRCRSEPNRACNNQTETELAKHYPTCLNAHFCDSPPFGGRAFCMQ